MTHPHMHQLAPNFDQRLPTYTPLNSQAAKQLLWATHTPKAYQPQAAANRHPKALQAPHRHQPMPRHLPGHTGLTPQQPVINYARHPAFFPAYTAAHPLTHWLQDLRRALPDLRKAPIYQRLDDTIIRLNKSRTIWHHGKHLLSKELPGIQIHSRTNDDLGTCSMLLLATLSELQDLKYQDSNIIRGLKKMYCGLLKDMFDKLEDCQETLLHLGLQQRQQQCQRFYYPSQPHRPTPSGENTPVTAQQSAIL